MKKLFYSLLILVLLTQFSQAFERFIPLELFTGGKIRNDTEIKFTKANLVFGEKKKKGKHIDWQLRFGSSCRYRDWNRSSGPSGGFYIWGVEEEIISTLK